MTQYQLKLSHFEGPLDLLLQLVERRRLEITTISLSLVVDQYLAHLASLDQADLDAWSEFIVIAARLLLIKSRAVLPPPRPPQESAPPEDALAEQLRRYRALRDGIHFLREQDEAGRRSFASRRQPPAVTSTGVLARHSLAELRDAYQRALLRRREVTGVVETQVVSVGDRIALIQSALAGGSLLFDQVLRDCRSRTEVVVTFLALLELIKQGIVRADQTERAGAIVVHRAGAAPAVE